MNPKTQKPAFRKRGFALVVTLTLMILLTVIAVGLLTLSSISLRSMGNNNAMSTARANARLAMMLAIGELQKAAGPDKAVTATSGITGASPGKPNLTGVWDSWDLNPASGNIDYDSPKTNISQPGSSPGFKGWLVSDSDPEESAQRNYPATEFSGETIELAGENTLGKGARDEDKVSAGKVKVARDGKITGNYAWHVSDESVKARINVYRDPSQNQTLSQKRALLAGHRPDVSVMKNRTNENLGFLPKDLSNNAYGEALATTGKIVSLNQVELLNNKPTIKTFRNDVTPYSLGLLTNVREGGLKQDLTSLFEMTANASTGVTGLPAEFNGKKVYQTGIQSGGTGVTGVSDPYWSALAGYYNTYKEVINPQTAPTLYKAPTQNVVVTSLSQPSQYSPLPVIAKIELLFSFIVRDKHGPWKWMPKSYVGHLLYIPIFTLHNPYNVNLQFDRMKIGLNNLPVGFIFNVNGVPQNSKLTPFPELFVGGDGRKEFWMELANWPSATATSPTGSIVMKPGQTMVFGPYINENEPFGDNNASFFDYGDNKTGTEGLPLKAKRGFAGKNIGFDLDWLCPGGFASSAAGGDGQTEMLGLNATDKVSIDFKVIPPARAPADRFEVKATITTGTKTVSCGGMSFVYGTAAVLDKIFTKNFRYPKTDGILASAMYHANTTPVNTHTTARAFALFSAYGRTANGGVDETGKRPLPSSGAVLPDGRLAGMPFLHHNPARAVVSSNLVAERPGAQSHELNLISLKGETDDAFDIAADFRTNYLLGYKQVAGRSIKSGSYLEIPTGPLQAIADFRRSNVLSSPYLPAFVQPIGNSYVSPLMSTNSVSQTGVTTYALLDQSFLSNHSLYDRYYFSTIVGVNGNSSNAAFTDFLEDKKPLPSQLFQAYLPADKTVADATSEMFSSNGKPAATAYKVAAGYQMVKGPFNVNSTQVEAWKAVLSSMNHSEMLTLWAKSGALETRKSNRIPIPAMTLHSGSSTNETASVSNIDDQIGNQWNGYREFSDSDIEKLATEIVEQVRSRGPFLSMSEFVNRRIGSDSELTRSGALQQAIDEAGLNEEAFSAQIQVSESDVSDANLYNYKTPKAAAGNPAAGAPGWLSQADIMKVLEPAATVRSDTFVIRTCGEAIDGSGKIVARAYAEAVVQRVPEYLNPKDAASVNVYTDQNAAPENIAFGRKFSVVSFRWLSANEI